MRKSLVAGALTLGLLAPAGATLGQESETTEAGGTGASVEAPVPTAEPAVTTVTTAPSDAQDWIYTLLPPVTVALVVLLLLAALVGAFVNLVIRTHTRRRVET